jgi:hypothetical protein
MGAQRQMASMSKNFRIGRPRITDVLALSAASVELLASIV